jgi:hypothetical protein
MQARQRAPRWSDCPGWRSDCQSLYRGRSDCQREGLNCLLLSKGRSNSYALYRGRSDYQGGDQTGQAAGRTANFGAPGWCAEGNMEGPEALVPIVETEEPESHKKSKLVRLGEATSGSCQQQKPHDEKWSSSLLRDQHIDSLCDWRSSLKRYTGWTEGWAYMTRWQQC